MTLRYPYTKLFLMQRIKSEIANTHPSSILQFPSRFMFKNTITLQVEWGHCDPAGIVFYPNFFTWFDQGAHHLFDAAGANIGRLMEEHGGILPIVDAQARFLSPSRYGDMIQITSWVSEWKEKRLVVTHRIDNKGCKAVEGFEMRTWAMPDDSHANGLRSAVIPQSLKSCFPA